MTDQNIAIEAAWVVLMFDQANTNKKIERLGSREEKLRDAINDLRKALEEVKGPKFINEVSHSGTWTHGHSNAN